MALYRTVAILDRFLERVGQTLEKRHLQLVGVAAMLIAAKVEDESRGSRPRVADYADITDDAFTAADVIAMEAKLLVTMDFSLGQPLSLHFLRLFSRTGSVNLETHTVAKFVMEAALLHYELSHLPPSLMAASALLLSMLLTEPVPRLSLWTPTLQHYSSYSSLTILPVVFVLAKMMMTVGEKKLTKPVFKKYMSVKYLKVADKVAFKGDLAQKLAEKNFFIFAHEISQMIGRVF